MSIREWFTNPLRSSGLRRALFQVHLWSGIGLSLVKHIAESHGGTIRIEEPKKDSKSPEKRGESASEPPPNLTTFLLTLPLLDSPLS